MYTFITTSCSSHELTGTTYNISFITFRWSRLTVIHVIADPRKRSYISQAATVTFTYISEIMQYTLPFPYYFRRYKISLAHGSKYILVIKN